MYKLWHKLSRLGVNGNTETYEEKSLIILNQISMLAFPMTLTMGSVLFFSFGIKIVGMVLWFNGLLALGCLAINAAGYSDISRALISIVPSISLALASPIAKSLGVSRTIIFYIAPRIGLLIICLIPLFLFGFKRDKKLALGLAIPLLCFVFFDKIHALFGVDWRTFPMNYDEYPALVVATSALLLFIIASTLFIQKINADYEQKIIEQGKEIVREKEKSEQLLHNILPEEIAQELKTTGYATPQYYELVTVVFTDFKGFTQIAERLSPQQVIEELNTCFLAFDEICERHNLEKIKTIGDAYMCAGGLPIANRSNPSDAIHAALEMQTWMANWKAKKLQQNQPVWEVRIGIHSGDVIAGVIGKNKFAYDIWGDTVNLASRMESSGEVGKINISGQTYMLVKDEFNCVFRGKIEAKNKGEIEMYFVESLRTC
jgi:class 3 adenylate cyclase